jgi:hypothetical protein
VFAHKEPLKEVSWFILVTLNEREIVTVPLLRILLEAGCLAGKAHQAQQLIAGTKFSWIDVS